MKAFIKHERSGGMDDGRIVDFMVRDSKRDKIYAFYSSLCEELALAGL